jgi:TonB family protein
MNAYAGHVVEKVRSNWALPVYLQGRGIQASLRIYLDARGNVLRYQFSRPSGNDTFDENVVGAVKKSSPFAPPPEEMARGLRNSGLELDFPL